MSAKKSLDAVRRELDAIDDSIHDLLIKRTKLVERVARLKNDPAGALRPGREATILRRLAKRHSGGFPKPALVRIWNEIFSAPMHIQGPFSVAVYNGDPGGECRDLARDHYSGLTPMTWHMSGAQVIDTVARGEASVGVLPLPQQTDDDPWWPHLASSDETVPRIAARLPFGGPRDGHGADVGALVVGRMAQEATGHDRTYVVVDATEEIAMARLSPALADAGLDAAFVARWHNDQALAAWLYVAEIDGFVGPDDRRLTRLAESFDGLVKRTLIIGGYAVPLSAEELAPKAARARRRRS